jgi:hypothetical protein
MANEDEVLRRIEELQLVLSRLANRPAGEKKPIDPSRQQALLGELRADVVPKLRDLMIMLGEAPPATTGPAPTLSAAPAPKPTRFADFLHEIGDAMVQAQATLDLASDRYSHGTGPLVAPTSYRIPKMTAALRFALERNEDRGFNLLIYSSRSSERELNQQTLDLELVAVPAAPDFVADLEARRPRLSLLTGPTERAALVAAFLASSAQAGVPPQAKANADRLVIAVGRPRQTGSGGSMTQDVLVLLATPDTDGAGPITAQAGAWYMTLSDGVPQPQAIPIIEFGKAPDSAGDARRLLHNFAEPLCDAQAALAAAAGTGA